MSISDRLSIAPDGTVSVARDANGDGVREYTTLTTPADVEPLVVSKVASYYMYTDGGYGVGPLAPTFAFFLSGNAATGTKKYIWVCPYDGVSIAQIRARADTAPVGAALILDCNLNGTTLFTTQASRPTIADGAKPATVGAIDENFITYGDSVSFDIDQIGSGTAGANISVTVVMAY